jgi:acyl dehydratase
VGQRIKADLEITMDTGVKALWQASFFEPSPLVSSDEVARSLGLERAPIPFTMLMVWAVGLAVIGVTENAVVHLGLKNVRQYQPFYPGQTLRNFVQISGLRNTRDGANSVVRGIHVLTNEKDEVVFSLEKSTLFPPIPRLKPGEEARPPQGATIESPHPAESHLRSHMIRAAHGAALNRVRPRLSLVPGDLLLHRMVSKSHGSTRAGLSLAWLPHTYYLLLHAGKNLRGR